MLSLLHEPSSVKDAINLVKKLFKYKRFTNSIKLYRSYKRSKGEKMRSNPQIKGQPVALSIEPTTSCNLRCPQCPSGLRSFTRDTGMLDIDMFEKLVEDNYQTLLYLLLYFQGEPYLHPQFYELVKVAAKRDIYTATSTNAHYLNPENAKKTVESGLDRIIISIDGVTAESYKKYRIGGSLDKVLEGTKNLVAAKKEAKSNTPFIIWQFIVFSHNEHEIEAVKKMGNAMGVDQVAIKTAQVYDETGAQDLLPQNEELNRYQSTDNLQLKNPMKDECWKMWHSCVITWDGFVVPCCFDKDASYQLGNIQENSLATIWQGSKYQAFRKTLWKGRKNIPICTNCSEGTKVWEF